jgi:exonuclease SbcC
VATRAWREAVAAREHAAARVLDAARACGLDEPEAERAAVALAEWEAARPARAVVRDQARRDWARRGALLDGRTVPDLLSEASEAETRAAKAADGFTESDLVTVVEAEPDRLRAAARDATARALGAEAALAERARALPSLAEAEEALERADTELARVRELDDILTLTRGFLVEAQDRVHRDIAPVLAGQVRQALPAVTGGRYTEVLVDPSTLAVRVCGPSRRWRQASLLSHGTAEQVYLLLRIALARQLTRPGTRCPLLLDDVTVHADALRTEQLLELLLGAAEERQIVLFSQQDQVRDWALARATGDRHALRELVPVPNP